MNVYAVKFTCVSELKHKVGEEENGSPKFETQRISGKDGTMNVLAESPTSAGDIAKAHLSTEGVVEVNVHLVHELAKNVITVSDVGVSDDHRFNAQQSLSGSH